MNNLDLFWNWFNADCEDMGIQYTQTEQQTNNNILIRGCKLNCVSKE